MRLQAEPRQEAAEEGARRQPEPAEEVIGEDDHLALPRGRGVLRPGNACLQVRLRRKLAAVAELLNN